MLESCDDLALNFQAITTIVTGSHWRNRSQEFNEERDFQVFDTRICPRDPPTSPLHRFDTRFSREIELPDIRSQLFPEACLSPCIIVNLSVFSSHTYRENWTSCGLDSSQVRGVPNEDIEESLSVSSGNLSEQFVVLG